MQFSPSIFKAYDVRGVVPSTLNEDVAHSLGRAFGQLTAATENFLVLENHDVDRLAWGDIIDGVEKPIVNKGFIPVPEGPGLGFKINEEALRKQVKGGYFEPTPQWDADRVNDRLYS